MVPTVPEAPSSARRGSRLYFAEHTLVLNSKSRKFCTGPTRRTLSISGCAAEDVDTRRFRSHPSESVSAPTVQFSRWKKAVGLPEVFPRLGVLSFAPGVEDARLYSPAELDDKRTELVERLQGPALRVVVPLGHGATTLARWVVNQVEAECLQMRMIPLLVSLDDLVNHKAALETLTAIAKTEGSQFKEPSPYERTLTDSPLHITLPDLASVSGEGDDGGRREPLTGRARKELVKRALAVADRVTQAALGHIEADGVLDRAVHAAVARSLVTARWDRVIGDYRYAAILDAPDSAAATITQRRRHLSELLFPMNDAPIEWDVVRAESPNLADKDRLAEFLRDNELRISVHLDLSCTRYGRLTVRDAGDPQGSYDQETPWFEQFVVQTFLARVKAMAEEGAGLAAWDRGDGRVVRVVEYLSQNISSRFDKAFPSERSKVDTTAFDALDVFAVLAAQYPLEATDQRRPELVSAVITGGLIEEFVQDRMALTSMVRELEDFLNSEDNFTYHVQGRRYQRLPLEVDDLQTKVRVIEEVVADHALRISSLETGPTIVET